MRRLVVSKDPGSEYRSITGSGKVMTFFFLHTRRIIEMLMCVIFSKFPVHLVPPPSAPA